MPTVEPLQRGPAPRQGGREQSRASARRLVWPALAVVLLGGLALRLWGIGDGLPYIYSIDELGHFVPHAVRMFEDGSLNPRYFANPPAFTYLLHAVFWVAYGGAAGVVREYAAHRADVFELARIVAAVLGTLSLWLLYLTGARLFGRAVGLLAAALQAVAFLPVFYGHLALNDVPTLAPLSASLLGSAGILRKGRTRDYLLAGAGLGLACATKYTAGIVLVPLLAAALIRYLDSERAQARATIGRLALAGLAALAAFIIANPYSLLDYGRFHAELVHQSTLSAETQGKLGAPKEPAIVYYLWSLTWGLGWLPALAALGGALSVWRRDARAGLLLVPASLLFLIFMGTEGRFFGRWLMPMLPLACLLAAFFAALVIGRGAALLGALAPAHAGRRALLASLLGALVVALLLAQGVVYSVHSGLVLAREDTRTSTREWMLAHVPRGTPIVAEPVSFEEWDREMLPGRAPGSQPHVWIKYPSLLLRVAPDGALLAHPKVVVGIEDYERTLAPALLGYYTAHGYCWVLSGSTESGRAFADPRAVPHATAYYRALAREGEVVYTASPYGAGKRPVAFNFDWSFDYYPLAYARPGPLITLYRLHGGRCGARH
jgi:4-amino-4-deoxy-L-arabinose transferase-like glycosyltransferase